MRRQRIGLVAREQLMTSEKGSIDGLGCAGGGHAKVAPVEVIRIDIRIHSEWWIRVLIRLHGLTKVDSRALEQWYELEVGVHVLGQPVGTWTRLLRGKRIASQMIHFSNPGQRFPGRASRPYSIVQRIRSSFQLARLATQIRQRLAARRGIHVVRYSFGPPFA